MRNRFRLFLTAALAAAAFAVTARAADDDKSKRVQFDTIDGVTLEGTFWPSDPAAGVKDKGATVLLLHNIDKVKGGSSHQAGWDTMAKILSQQGYSVMSFDFRGFGNSHAVAKDFWDPVKNKQNVLYVKGANKNPPPDSIDHKDFDSNASQYYPYLTNDISAAKSFLDRQTDKGQANSSNLILVGAGEGATLGAMWMASQWHLKAVNGVSPQTGQPTLGEPEGRDAAGAVWLSISPKLGGMEIPSTVKSWLADLAGSNKVPMVFIYGDKEEGADTFAKQALKSVENQVRKENPGWNDEKVKERIQYTNVKAVDNSKLSGNDLLTDDGLQGWVQKYLAKVVDDRGPREPRKHDVKDDTFFWTFPGVRLPIEAKMKGEENIHTVPVQNLLRMGN